MTSASKGLVREGAAWQVTARGAGQGTTWVGKKIGASGRMANRCKKCKQLDRARIVRSPAGNFKPPDGVLWTPAPRLHARAKPLIFAPMTATHYIAVTSPRLTGFLLARPLLRSAR